MLVKTPNATPVLKSVSGINLIVKSIAPAISQQAVKHKTDLTRVLTSPIVSEPMLSFSSIFCFRLIFLFAIFINIARKVIKPKPPIWISDIITTCPKADQVVKVSNGTRPVMQVAEVAVNNASINDMLPTFELTGSIKSPVPKSINKAKPNATIFGYDCE